jgi:hypothetical protein
VGGAVTGRAGRGFLFRYNNYLSRFHWRHLDLMDVISGFQVRGRSSLADVACLPPGKLGFDGSRCSMPGRRATSPASAATAKPTSQHLPPIFLSFE